MARGLPAIIRDVGFAFSWDEKDIWPLDVPVETIPMTELDWHFAIPFWNHAGKAYCLSAQQVIDDPQAYPEHAAHIRQADTSYPIDIALNPKTGRWTILDGLHRLVRLASEKHTTVRVRKIPLAAIPVKG